MSPSFPDRCTPGEEFPVRTGWGAGRAPKPVWTPWSYITLIFRKSYNENDIYSSLWATVPLRQIPNLLNCFDVKEISLDLKDKLVALRDGTFIRSSMAPRS
jgi:hypothetical protein